MINTSLIHSLPADEQLCISRALQKIGITPSLEEIWTYMDTVWDEMGCSHTATEQHAAYYQHAVWTINGLFIEQHADSLNNRRLFAEYITATTPSRIADFGGGFGSLARMCAANAPTASIEIIEPYPSQLGIQLCTSYPNISYSPLLHGEYDFIIATDVLEHVNDPLKLAEYLISHLAMGGTLLLANCFYPVIKCHLPSTFHLRYSFEYIIQQMGIKKSCNVAYGTAYIKNDSTHLTTKIRLLERISRIIYPFLEVAKKIKHRLRSIGAQ